MNHPFSDPDRPYLVLVNDEGQHSLWPASIEVPAGWTTATGPASRTDCVDYVNANWIDTRPNSLASSMGHAGGTAAR